MKHHYGSALVNRPAQRLRSLTGSNDTINGLGGNDIIFADEGEDTVNGGDGDDQVFAGNGQTSCKVARAMIR